MGKSIYEKIFDSHVVGMVDDETYQLYVDRHLVHEVTSPQAFANLAVTGRTVRRPKATLAVADHNVPTDNDRSLSGIVEEVSRHQVEVLERNTRAYGIPYIPLDDVRQGIVHVIGPEQGMTHPGMLVVCGDSHTSTHGAFGALAFGIGTSEVEHVLATQTLLQKRFENMLIEVTGRLPRGVFAKDVILCLIARMGTAGGNGTIVEYRGDTFDAMSMEERMTVCNMTTEGGARAGLMRPDHKTFEFLRGRLLAPDEDHFERAVAHWTQFVSDPDATYAKTVKLNASTLVPYVTWGTSPEDGIPIDAVIPDVASFDDPVRKRSHAGALSYMGIEPGTRIDTLPVDQVFIGSCTNSRIEDLRVAASIVKGHTVSSATRAWVVPGSGLVRRQAEAEGLARIFIDAGFEWRQPGCSMCLAMNPDKVAPGLRCVSTSNRNFEGRQGRGARTHLASPATAAASAIAGRITDPREFL